MYCIKRSLVVILLMFLVSPHLVQASDTHAGETKLDPETIRFTKDWKKDRNPKITIMIENQGRFIIDLEIDHRSLALAIIKAVQAKQFDKTALDPYSDGVSIALDSSLGKLVDSVDHLHAYKKGTVALKLEAGSAALYLCTRTPQLDEGNYVPIGTIIEGLSLLEKLPSGSSIRDAFVSPYLLPTAHHH